MKNAIRQIALLLGALLIFLAAPASAQEPGDEYYEAFNADAPKLVFHEPSFVEIEFTNPRTMATERKRADPRTLAAETDLEIYIFRIGRADSMLIVGPCPARKTLLVDLGVPKESGFSGRFSAELVGQRIIDITGKKSIDYFLLSHFHEDHFGSGDSGITALISHDDFTVGTVIDTGDIATGYLKRSKSAKEYIARFPDWISSGKVGQRIKPKFGISQIKLGPGVKVDIVAFGGRTYSGDAGVHSRYSAAHPGHYTSKPASENDLSIALEVSVGDFEFWTAGDLSGASGDGTAALSGSSKNYTNVEYPLTKRWLSAGGDRDVEIYRASHHGAQYSSTPQLLAALDPEIILYSARVGHGHPSPPMVGRAGATAHTQITTGYDSGAWTTAELAEESLTVADEIRAFVEPGGKRYSVNGKSYKAYTDAEERSAMTRETRDEGICEYMFSVAGEDALRRVNPDRFAR